MGDGVRVAVEHGPIHNDLAVGPDLGAAKHRSHAHQQLVTVDGLDHIVVDTAFKTDALVADRIFRRHHDDGEFAAHLAYFADELIARKVRHHFVTDEHIDMTVQKHIEGFRSVPGRQNGKPFPAQDCRQKRKDIFIVIGDQDRHLAPSFLSPL